VVNENRKFGTRAEHEAILRRLYASVSEDGKRVIISALKAQIRRERETASQTSKRP
jgi:hypothetical protein